MVITLQVWVALLDLIEGCQAAFVKIILLSSISAFIAAVIARNSHWQEEITWQENGYSRSTTLRRQQ